MKILFIGDVIGKPGRRAIKELLPALQEQEKFDLVIGNGENAAGGSGLTPSIYDEMLNLGIDYLTSGNHIWDKKEVTPLLTGESCVIRPANYPAGAPGRGSAVISAPRGGKLGLLNLSGRVFMRDLDCPFRAADQIIPELKAKTPLILVDFHAEATSEKVALGHYLDGRVSAVLGTHTHIQTADDRVLDKGTAYITDCGMCGALDSVIGIRKELAIQRFLTQLPVRFEPSDNKPMLQGVILDLDDASGKARSIIRVCKVTER